MTSVDVPIEVNAIDDIPGFIHQIFNPRPLSSFRSIMPSGELTIIVNRQQGSPPDRIILTNMFPFMTLKDIKIALCLELKRKSVKPAEYEYLVIFNHILFKYV